MNLSKLSVPAFCFSLRWLCAAIMLLSIVITWWAPKDDNSDAWAYHYYSGAMLLDQRLELDYFGASVQSYFNPLVHLPFAAMVKAGWPDLLVGIVMALYSAMALCLITAFYRLSLGLVRWELAGAVAMSLAGLVVWTCTGTSVPDLFLQIPVILALFFLFAANDHRKSVMLFLSGFFLGVALGLKLSAVVYVPAFGVLLLLGLFSKKHNWQGLLFYCLGGLAGFLLSYGWWGAGLYRLFGNPFFPFFNDWFKSPHFAHESLANRRFLSWSLLEQALLPFRASFSDAYTYIELREPDIRPGVFVLSVVLLAGARLLGRSRVTLAVPERDFLVFLVVALYSWVFLSGNGRYGVGIFAMLGAGILIALRSALPFRPFRTIFLLVLLLQFFVISRLWTEDAPPFRYSKTPWGGQWFNVNFQEVLGRGNQLVFTGTRSIDSVLVKDMGPNSALINVYGVYALEYNPAIEKKIAQYEGNILGMVRAGSALQENRRWIEKAYFEQFSRLGLALKDYKQCRFTGRVNLTGSASGGFLFCPLVKDDALVHKYYEKTADAGRFFQRIEEICPDVFSPKKYAITLLEQSKEKYYANYEIEVYLRSTERAWAKKQWSMMIFPLGSLAETYSLSPVEWRMKYCEPLRRSRAMSSE